MNSDTIGYKILRSANNQAWDIVWKKLDSKTPHHFSLQWNNVENGVWSQISPISDEVRQYSRRYFNDLLRKTK